LLFTNISTLLTHISETRDEGPPAANGFAAFIAIALRKISFTPACAFCKTTTGGANGLDVMPA